MGTVSTRVPAIATCDEALALEVILKLAAENARLREELELSHERCQALALHAAQNAAKVHELRLQLRRLN